MALAAISGGKFTLRGRTADEKKQLTKRSYSAVATISYAFQCKELRLLHFCIAPEALLAEY